MFQLLKNEERKTIMKILFLFLSATVSLVQSADYDISNFQICTRKPFFANFAHNCSRKRLVEDVQMANSDKIIFLYMILPNSNNETLSLTVRNRVDYSQKIYFLFITHKQRTIYFSNYTVPIVLSNLTLSTYFYDPLSNYFGPIRSEVSLTKPTCEYLDKKYLPSENISRIYYIYTNQSNLDFDFSISTNQISPVIIDLQICYGSLRKLTPLAIFLICFTSVICLITIIFIIDCLYRQVVPLIGILRNRTNIPPTIHVE